MRSVGAGRVSPISRVSHASQASIPNLRVTRRATICLGDGRGSARRWRRANRTWHLARGRERGTWHWALGTGPAAGIRGPAVGPGLTEAAPAPDAPDWAARVLAAGPVAAVADAPERADARRIAAAVLVAAAVHHAAQVRHWDDRPVALAPASVAGRERPRSVAAGPAVDRAAVRAAAAHWDARRNSPAARHGASGRDRRTTAGRDSSDPSRSRLKIRRLASR